MPWEQKELKSEHAMVRKAEAVVLSDAAQAVAVGLRRPSVSPNLVGAIALGCDTVALGVGLWFAVFASAGDTFAPLKTAGLAVCLALGVSLAGWLLGWFRLRELRRFGHGATRLLCLAVPMAVIAGVDPLALLLVVGFLLPAHGLGALLAGSALDFGLTERRAIIVGGGERGFGSWRPWRPRALTSGSAASSTTGTMAARRRYCVGCQSSELSRASSASSAPPRSTC